MSSVYYMLCLYLIYQKTFTMSSNVIVIKRVYVEKMTVIFLLQTIGWIALKQGQRILFLL